jgi:formate hydrogenlyase transcriptional activator
MTTESIHKKLYDPRTASLIQDLKRRAVDLENQLHDLKIQAQNDKRLQEELMERLKFEKLLSEISSSYTNLPTSEIDNTIEHGLQQIGKFLKADRCNLSQLSKDLKGTHIIHSWSNEGVKRLPRFFVDISAYFPWILNRTLQGKYIKFSHPDELPEAAAKDKESFSNVGTLSHIGVPIRVGGSILGHLSIDTLRTQRTWPDELVNQLQRIGEVFANAVARKQKDLEIQRAFSEIKMLKEQIEADCTYLREEIDMEYNSHNMIGHSGLFKHLLLKIQQIAPTNVTVLILGETGTGKELVARAIHEESPRKNRPMVKVNCAALPANLIESELFGHEKGAFTSAQARQVGRFELANGNTLFLDEIGELPMESQAKLLRVLQEGEFERLGSSRTIKVDVRIIAASNRAIEDEVKKGRFRQDLWYRLNVFPIIVPSLRQREEDIELLATYFLKKFSKKMGKKINKIPSDVIIAMKNYQWPGNIRELENVIERAVVNTQGHSLQLLDNLALSNPPHLNETHGTPIQPIEAAERNLIIQALEKTKWRIEGPKGAALMLGLNPSTLRNKMRKHGIQRD